MQDKIRTFFSDNYNKWKALDTKLQRRLALGIIGLLIAIAATIFFIVRQPMVVAFQGLDWSTVGRISQVLDENNIRHNTIRAGTAIEVRQRDHDNARMLVHGHPEVGDLPAPRFGLQDLLEGTGMATSEDTRQEMVRTLRQGGIETMLENLEFVNQATVTIVAQNNRQLFVRDGQAASASVLLATNRNITNSESEGVAGMVSNAVEGLSTDNITIMNQHGIILFDGSGIGDGRFPGAVAGNGISDPLMQIQLQQRIDWEMGIMALLGGLFDRVDVTASPRFNLESELFSEIRHMNPVEGGGNRGLIQSIREIMESATGRPIEEIFEPGVGASDLSIPTHVFGG